MSEFNLHFFMLKVRKLESGCWEWVGHKNRGYGILEIDRRKSGGLRKTYKAHRVSYELHKGSIPEGVLITHTCDNPSCVNPGHLQVGDDQSNSDEKWRRGRGVVGERLNKGVLTEKTVQQIRKLYATGNYTQRELAKEFNTCHGNISYVTRNRTWKRREGDPSRISEFTSASGMGPTG